LPPPVHAPAPPKPRFSDRTAAWQRARKAALHRDGHRCVHCGATPTQALRLHVHHIVPRAQGGSHALGNLLTLCDVCHPLVEREGSVSREANVTAPRKREPPIDGAALSPGLCFAELATGTGMPKRRR
jgi:5-methylcytosine-specific restriction endonuclease McrA